MKGALWTFLARLEEARVNSSQYDRIAKCEQILLNIPITSLTP
ncbi:hypothetical protein THOG11_40235 [Vibrio harveyi]|uniref:Uncharacterized protein n=1 Tax=Vibrio harveyi TaxID=669 RepID=A0A454D0R8_VIBHA|nr:hypothetical protein VCHENC01_1803 [Vibrio harveyi]EKM32250.1 hypothetical protein VCHENC02_2174 [Vibrio harveyi]CAH1554017.1 hypothetical protein THOD03_190040 [Vibrio harveyi]CAH1577553.1 hypothetical protein THOG11_40235 [Vibrio harveyi]